MVVTLVNGGQQPFTIEPGFRIAQMLITTVFRYEAVEAEQLSDTARGAGGFGSTGIR